MGARSSRITAQNNRSDGHLLEYFRKSFVRGGGGTNASPGFGPPQGLTATGGVISDYADGPTVYRAHIFTSLGTFNVTGLSASLPNNVEYLVVAGGGGGSARHGGGGGGGGLLVSPGFPGIPTSQNQGTTITVPASVPAPYSITVGAGGAGGVGPDTNTTPSAIGSQGNPSSFGPVSTTGGGYGASFLPNPPGAHPGGPGGSGGGGGHTSTSVFGVGGPATNYPGPTQQGYPGGAGGPGVPSHGAGGGGGAGEVGQNSVSPQTGGRGGAGLTLYIAAPPTQPAPENSYAGGGGGGGDNGGAGSPIGGGGAGKGGPYPGTSGISGTYATGGGGGGARTIGAGSGGAGGSGIVVVRYQIGQLTAAAKATGGAISYYNNKTIHTFTSTGTFTAPGTFSETVEYVVIGAGGGGGGTNGPSYVGGGGGGAGNYKTGTTPVSGPFAAPVSIGAGGGFGNGTYVAPVSVGSAGGTTTLGFPSPISSVGGAGGGHGASTGPSNTSGSGGGGGWPNQVGGPTSGAPFPGTIGATPPAGFAHAGGNAYNPNGGGGGGGGAGGAGSVGTGPSPNYGGGPGGFGIQLPSTFRNPASTVGAPGPTSPPVSGADTSGKYYVAGGGGAGLIQNLPGSAGVGGGAGGPYAGAGSGSSGPRTTPGGFALENTGSGGGGGVREYPSPDQGSPGGSGGSGIVLIAYPS